MIYDACMKLNYNRICVLLAMRNCYNSGTSVKDLAKFANKSTSTIYKWLKLTE